MLSGERDIQRKMTASSFNKRSSQKPAANDHLGHARNSGGPDSDKLMRNPSGAYPQQNHSKAASAAY